MEHAGQGIMSIYDINDERSFDELLGAQAIRDAPYHEMNDRRLSHDAIDMGYVAPAQIDHIFELEIDDRHRDMSKGRTVLKRSEVKELMEAE